MRISLRRHLGRIVLATAVFAAGYLLGTVTADSADAQMGDLGKKALESASESGGTLGAVSDLGTSIVDMREKVTALNQDLDKLEKIKAALGGH